MNECGKNLCFEFIMCLDVHLINVEVKKENEINWQDISAHKMSWISLSDLLWQCVFFSRKRFSNVINSSVIRIGCITKYSTGRRNEGISRNDTFLWHHKLTKQTFPIFNRCNTHSQKKDLKSYCHLSNMFFFLSFVRFYICNDRLRVLLVATLQNQFEILGIDRL